MDWPKELGTSLSEKASEIRRKASAAVDPPILPHFTDHSGSHFDRVASNFRALIKHTERSEKALSKNELFIGLAACYLHDVGLQTTAGVPSARVGALSSADLLQIRERHAEVANNWIVQTLRGDRTKFPDLQIPDLGIDAPDDVRELAPYIAKLCQLHSGDPKKVAELTNVPFHGEVLRLPLVAHLLRLADALDLDTRRVNMRNLDRWKLEPASLLHWWRHHYVQSVSIDDTGGIRIVMVFHLDLTAIEIETFRQMVQSEITREISPAEIIFRENGLFPSLLSVTVSQDFSDAKRPLPRELKQFIGRDVTTPISPEQMSQPTEPSTGKLSWIGHWNFRGNPWNDLPISYADLEFVETRDVASKMSELDSLLDASRGEIRLVFGKRGSGKTTFLENIEEAYRDRAVLSVHDLSGGPPVTNAQQLHAWVFPRILADLTDRAEEGEVGPRHFRDAMNSFHLKKPIILIDNLDRFAEKADVNMIRQFFQLSQGELQAMKRKSLIIISATDEWKSDMQSTDLSYIGKSSFWDISPFSAPEIKTMIEKRLRVAGSSYEDIFDENAYKVIHRISGGNPRRALDICSLLCISAARENVTKLVATEIETAFQNELQNKVAGLVVQASRTTPATKAGLEGIYAFYLGAERSGPLAEDAWGLARDLVQTRTLEHELVPPALTVVLQKIASLKSEVRDGTERKYWSLNNPTRDFLRAIKDQGLPIAEFMSYYKDKPIIPQGADHEVIMRTMAVAKLSGDVRTALQRASRAYEDVKVGNTVPTRVLMKARWCIEYLVVAYLHKIGTPLPGSYLGDHEEGRFLNSRGRTVQKFPGRCIADLRALMAAFDSSKDRYVESYRELKLIQKRSEDYFRDPNFGAKMDNNDAKLIAAAISKIFQEFSPLIMEE